MSQDGKPMSVPDTNANQTAASDAVKDIRKSITEASLAEAGKQVDMRKQAARKAEQKKKKASSKYHRPDIERIKQVFDDYDVDGDGQIELAELWAALRKQREQAQRYDGRRRSLAERQSATGVVTGKRLEKKNGAEGVFLSSQCLPLFSAMDTNGDGTVTFRELLGVLYPCCAAGELEVMLSWVAPPKVAPEQGPRLSDTKRAEIRRLFSLYDTDRSGDISVPGLHAALGRCALGAAEVERLFAQFDADHNRRIEFDEFVALMESTGAFYDD